jgi:hypothetical protein
LWSIATPGFPERVPALWSSPLGGTSAATKIAPSRESDSSTRRTQAAPPAMAPAPPGVYLERPRLARVVAHAQTGRAFACVVRRRIDGSRAVARLAGCGNRMRRPMESPQADKGSCGSVLLGAKESCLQAHNQAPVLTRSIAYSRRPTASRASWRSRKTRIRLIFPSAKS